MKTYITIILSISLLLVACNSNQSKDSKKDQEEAVESTSSELKEAKDCDEFIDQYEEWMDKYLEFLEKYVKDPMDSKLANEYMTLAQEGMNWMSQWTSKLYVCSSNEKYQKRFDDISEKVDKKLEELGFK